MSLPNNVVKYFICSYRKDPTTPLYIYLDSCYIITQTKQPSIDSAGQLSDEEVNPDALEALEFKTHIFNH